MGTFDPAASLYPGGRSARAWKGVWHEPDDNPWLAGHRDDALVRPDRAPELVRVRDGKIVVDNLYYDNLAVAAQLGLLPQDVPTTV